MAPEPEVRPHTKGEVDRAGAELRDWWRAGAIEVDDDIRRALDVVWAYRASFQVPLTKVVMSVRSHLKAERVDVIVAQRLKRLPTILDKLCRLPTMNLSQMQDIGGCRAILPEGGFKQIAGVQRRVESSRSTVLRTYDYIATPKRSGYRAVHLVVERDARTIEIQLRTSQQHRWAESVERAGSQTGTALKDGQGPKVLLEYLERLAYALALQEAGVSGSQLAAATFEAVRLLPEALRAMGVATKGQT